ncbi:MAG: chorismate-binding protein, partial [Rubricoccaceae bacterium]|nr:chorismate-binding protein [Rubricoccaceae bacterium]
IQSFSPELFFRVDGREVTARPMKGTTTRSVSMDEDEHLAAALRSDEKNRAENLMIVDLLRNDLSRVSEAGSVHVPELFTIEQYETVTQMTSTIKAHLREEAQLSDVFRALFPCGSVTGAPKIRAMEIIRDLETTPRGVYCGAIGYASPMGQVVFSVPIRTISLKPTGREEYEGCLGVGSGVVWDSDAMAEYEECLLKARFLTDLLR